MGALPKLPRLFLQVAECLQELDRHLQELQATQALRGQRLEQSQGLRQLGQKLELAEAWLASQEGLLLDPSYGVSGGRSCRCLLIGAGLSVEGQGRLAPSSEPHPRFSQRSVTDVEHLLSRHEGLEKLLVAQEETFTQLQMAQVPGLDDRRLSILRGGIRGWSGGTVPRSAR